MFVKIFSAFSISSLIFFTFYSETDQNMLRTYIIMRIKIIPLASLFYFMVFNLYFEVLHFMLSLATNYYNNAINICCNTHQNIF